MDRFIYKEESKRISKNSDLPVVSLFNTTFTKVILLVVSVFLFYNIVNSINITVQKLDILKRANIEVDALRLKNLELALLLDSMQTKEYLEIQARDRLNFAGEREYIFVIPDAVLEEKRGDLEIILQGDMVKESRQTYEIWKDFLFSGI